jgi:signal recognition particle receptor subunit beta
MSFINYNAKEIHCKIVYYGPSLGGKTTNIQWIYQKTATDQKSKLIALNTANERTYFFDFLPLGFGQIRGFNTKFHLYTVPGQTDRDMTRKLILKGLDGVIFVADSQSERWEENMTSMNNLEANLKQQGYDIRQVPLVVQYNKRDIPGASPVVEMRKALNRFNATEYEAIATQGIGVFESLKTLSKSIISVLKGGSL